MGNTKAASNEQIIAALLQHGTIKAAAEAVGLSPRAIYERMRDKEFRADYEEAKTDIMRKAVYTINEQLCAAVTTIAEIMADKSASPAIRLQAAQIIINNAGKFADRLSHGENLSRETRHPLDFDFEL